MRARATAVSRRKSSKRVQAGEPNIKNSSPDSNSILRSTSSSCGQTQLNARRAETQLHHPKGCSPWDADTGLKWAELLAHLRTTGNAMPIKDSLIAATALVHGLAVATRNRADFVKATAMSGSCARSHSTTRGSGLGFVGSLRTLAPIRYFTAHLSTRSRWARRSPSADRPAANRWCPRSAEPHAGRGDSPHDGDARRRTPAPVPHGPSAGIPPGERLAPWRKW